ncbi:uncharacterized protein BXZ73DRAFT_76050 [Epithele typhae]|uniref:uncharacterized protein n=1 Tax=Epithele typhae TaxID=378194 RepID=UPI0020082B5D|nr:uncharacterized protein BXZ73DRAFT_76050 [Epithele typhae]KAH9939339.1 hypothetical protein BXZ73DRAFT_76050 [Epithele typhae]
MSRAPCSVDARPTPQPEGVEIIASDAVHVMRVAWKNWRAPCVPDDGAKRCSGCRDVRYCNQDCQRQHWPIHIFDCDVDQPISTVYHLSRACHTGIVPAEYQTRRDYGFTNASRSFGRASEEALLKFYRAVLDIVSLQQLRRWQSKGHLLQGIKAVLEHLPPASRGSHYHWFLEHQIVFQDPASVAPAAARFNPADRFNDVLRKGWIHMGGSPDTPQEAIEEHRRGMLPPTLSAHFVYVHSVAREIPLPEMEEWVSFGFVTASSPAALGALGVAYHNLAHASTFDEFAFAHKWQRLPALFRRFDISVPDPRFLDDVLSGKREEIKTVWHLKALVDTLAIPHDSGSPPRDELLAGTTAADYGYARCRDDAEIGLLDKLYLRLFVKMGKGMDPLELHEARERGRLVEYVGRFVELEPHGATYAQLLQDATHVVYD